MCKNGQVGYLGHFNSPRSMEDLDLKIVWWGEQTRPLKSLGGRSPYFCRHSSFKSSLWSSYVVLDLKWKFRKSQCIYICIRLFKRIVNKGSFVYSACICFLLFIKYTVGFSFIFRSHLYTHSSHIRSIEVFECCEDTMIFLHTNTFEIKVTSFENRKRIFQEPS